MRSAQRYLIALATLLVGLCAPGTLRAQVLLRLADGDCVCLVGGGAGDAIAREGSFEALLHTRAGEGAIKVRSLCWPGDEVVRRPRATGFPDAEAHLRREGASVVIGFFGGSESAAGQDGLEAFRSALEGWVERTLMTDYRAAATAAGATPPAFAPGTPPKTRVVLVTPPAAEAFPGDPDTKRLNATRQLYANAVRGTASKYSLPLADLFAASERAWGAGGGFTTNGITPSPAGAERLAAALESALFGRSSGAPGAQLLAAVRAKADLERRRYRPANHAALYGAHAGLGFEPDRALTNGTVLGKEMEILDALLAKADASLTVLASGSEPGASPPPPPAPAAVATNYGSGRNRGKEGSLNYLKPSQAKRRFRPDAPYAIDLWACELDFPELVNPTASCWGPDGRLWVTCAPSYPAPAPGSEPDDKVLVLGDRDRDGRADTCEVFAAGLALPTGIAVGDGGAYVACAPDLLFLADTDGDGLADRHEVLLTGFDNASLHAAISSLEWGADGALYFCEGSGGASAVETLSGTVRREGGGVYRYHPATRELRLHASYTFGNARGLAFDEWGAGVVADADTGAFYNLDALSGSPPPNGAPGPARPFARARNEPSHAPVFVTGSHFPEDAGGDLLAASMIARLGVLYFDLRGLGGGAERLAQESLPVVLTTDGNFRPVDLDFGPDGALYVTDWHNALLDHTGHHLRDPERDRSHGRIWRVVAKGRGLDRWPEIAGKAPPELLPLLAHGDPNVRRLAMRELRRSPADAVLAAALRWGTSLDRGAARYEHHLLALLDLHAHFARPNASLLRSTLRAKRPEARAAATRLLGEWLDSEPGAISMLEVLAKDPDPAVRLQALRACSFADDPRALEIVENATPEPGEPDPDAPGTPSAIPTKLPGQLGYVQAEALKALRERFPPPSGDEDR